MVDVEGLGQHVSGVGMQTGECLGIGPSHPRRGLDQAVTVGVLADGGENLTDGRLDPRLVDRDDRRPLGVGHGNSLDVARTPTDNVQRAANRRRQGLSASLTGFEIFNVQRPRFVIE